MKGTCLIFTFLFITLSCDPDVRFSDAMPPGIDSIESIPVSFHGTYMCESDGSRVFIDKMDIVLESYYKIRLSLADVEETEHCSIVAGGLYLPGRKECIPFEYISEDSITARVYELDTMVDLRRGNDVIKFYRGHLFINKSDGEGSWTAWMLSPHESGGWRFELIDIPAERDSIEAVTHSYTVMEVDSEEVNYLLDPTLVEFDRILDKKYITTCDVLQPINLEIKVFRN